MSKLTPKDIAKMLDHSTLQPYLTQDDVRKGCEIALQYQTASVCARPADMKLVAEMLKGSDVHVCTVIGFPHGNHLPQIKLAETKAALDDGCEELDMVINVGRLIAGEDGYVQDEIRAICDLAHGRGAKVKVIIETCYLTDDEKRIASRLCEKAGAAYVKTSTGFGTRGASVEDILLIRETVSPHIKIKASTDINNRADAERLIAAGAVRLGVSRTPQIVEDDTTLVTATVLNKPPKG